MPPAPVDLAPVESALARSNARLVDLLAHLRRGERVDATGLAGGATAFSLARAQASLGRPMVVVTAGADSARREAASLAFFAGVPLDRDEPGEVLLFPPNDTSPYLEVAPDRRAAMDRLAVLFHLEHALPWRFLVTPISGLLRRTLPRAAIRARSRIVRAEEPLDREDFLRTLVDSGYLRVPVAEDPGTFAVRGALVDVFPPHARYPARIELDDWLVLGIKLFDPDDQRSLRAIPELHVHPVREVDLSPEGAAAARPRIVELCDAVDLPTTRRRQLLDDLAAGRSFPGLEGLLPAFHPALETLLDYVPATSPVVVLDPAGVAREARDELEAVRAEEQARRAERAPVFDRAAHYASEEDTARAVVSRPLLVVHPLAVTGAGASSAGGLDALQEVSDAALLRLGATDHAPLVAELARARANPTAEHPVALVAREVRRWSDAGLRVVFTARTRTQAQRLATLLRAEDLRVPAPTDGFDPAELAALPPGSARIVLGPLAAGFSFATEALVLVTEEEVFGARADRRPPRRTGRDKAQAFSEDLRELAVGDYVVHVDHGIGRYLGLERKGLGQTALERMQGARAASVEVLVIEYAGGDRLFLPLTRLNQIQKFAGRDGATPRLDRLGGQTFGATKGRVRRALADLADKLLELYAARTATTRPALPAEDPAYAEFEATFPFEETLDQARAIGDVLGDLVAEHPMDRVVCGDVGFGKTEVALRAGFRVAMAGRQVAVLCPTTVLAQQHHATFKDRFRNYPLRVEVLSRFVERTDQTRVLAALKDGSIDVVVGTHRLLSKDVHFKGLGLLVVDEEQRFGVTAKERIKQLRTEVDVLTLTATPIPRTLQMAVGGLRELSVIATPPVDRRAVRTFVSRWDDHVLREAIRRELARGGQVFFVYNRIEGLYERAERLKALVPEARVAVGHGQMKEEALERTMSDFVRGEYDVLCATAIVESGLDIPRANTIILDRADLFGLAQLYQLRGRVGRARERAYCYLLTPPVNQMTDEARARLEALERFTELGSGFHLASLDMELRGAGDLLGAEQSGNVAAVGFDLFIQMLQEAVAEQRGETVVHEVDPELHLEGEQYLPEHYIQDVGVRLSFYKRLACASSEEAVTDLGNELEDRFGPLPPEARELVRAMTLRPRLRELRALGCEATRERVTLHLRQDTPLDPGKVMERIAREAGWKLTPDMKLTRRFPDDGTMDAIDRVSQTLAELTRLTAAR